MKTPFIFDHKKVHYKLAPDGKFVIENYNFAKPFSSFFPGIAGLYGIPMWVFYVNRGQGICSFGTTSKDQPILEFLPANQAYQMVFYRAFRTFIKLHDRASTTFYEPFQNSLQNAKFNRSNRMIIDVADVSFEEENKSLGLAVSVDYFTIPSDTFAALARTVTVRNNSKKEMKIELIDGLPIFIPYGLSNMFLKELGRTIEAWMNVENIENKAPFYRLKVDPIDRPEVIHIQKGNFFTSFYQNPATKATCVINPIVDPECIFDRINDLCIPYVFLKTARFNPPKKQIMQSRTPCALSYIPFTLEPNQSLKLYSLFGMMEHLEKLNDNLGRIRQVAYIEEKRRENSRLLRPLMQNAATVSSSRTFNLYAQRTFLDNVLRGGFPVTLDAERSEVVYVFSRKHGDLERDYNKFETQPTYFSQGNGNYRDILQNRRNDIFFNAYLGDTAIVTFFNLIQLDGFNPLVVKGMRYHLDDEALIASILKDYISNVRQRDLVRPLLSRPFYIGELFMFLEEHAVTLTDRSGFIREIIDTAIKHEEAEHKEGFWTDHWAYNLDMLESFLSVYPECLREIMLEKKIFSFYDDSWIVNPRSVKYRLYDGKPKQLGAVTFCKEKQDLIDQRATEPHKVRMENGRGEIYLTNLLEKFTCIIINKVASLDPFGVGIEMEANKPNWYDALNGLPALFGSSICETMELKRWIIFIKKTIQDLQLGADLRIDLAEEIYNLFRTLEGLFTGADASQEAALLFWDAASSAKEKFRQATIFGVSGKRIGIGLSDLIAFLDSALKKVERGIAAAYNEKTKAYTSYFINEVTEYKHIGEYDGAAIIRPLAFRQKPLPIFLEGFVHALRIADTRLQKKAIYDAVKKSGLYDSALGMYKVNVSLAAEPEEIGRAHAFSPGWLENESIWLHMEYKYLLELLRAGLYDEFYGDFFKALIPFQKPEQYGRSVLENSSFIASSAFVDASLHGNGFVARLSGSTCEFLNMWLLMNVGERPFFIDRQGKLALRFRPILSKELFTKQRQVVQTEGNGSKEITIEKHCYAFYFLGSCLVVYHNPRQLDTYGSKAARIEKIRLEAKDGKVVELVCDVLAEIHARAVRSGKLSRIDILLS